LFASKQQTVVGHAGTKFRSRLSRSAKAEHGFTLVELFVVCLIIGVLCAIAIPAFLTQSGKAKDASAKELLHTAQTAAETIGSENSGSYQNVTLPELNKVEPTISIQASQEHAYLSAATQTTTSYSITAVATDGDELTLTKEASGVVERTCKSPQNGCSEGATGTW